MRHDYGDENAIAHAAEAFAETVMLKVKQLRTYVPKGTNPTVTGAYVEEVVRGFVKDWVGHRQLLHGAFFSEESKASGLAPMQIDGIVYDPHRGPLVLREGGFAIVHPGFCTSVVEIKTSVSGSLIGLRERLSNIHKRYMHHVMGLQVMGIVIVDPDAEQKSRMEWPSGQEIMAYDYRVSSWHPMFVLFSERGGEYRAHVPAIEAMIRAIYTMQFGGNNLL